MDVNQRYDPRGKGLKPLAGAKGMGLAIREEFWYPTESFAEVQGAGCHMRLRLDTTSPELRFDDMPPSVLLTREEK